jgi:PIN domain nuclease of toxin-antitoxin system
MLRLLLDTHTFLWWVNDSPELSNAARQAISDKLTLVTADRMFSHYDVSLIW